jgi:fused signal recognition particle receptor
VFGRRRDNRHVVTESRQRFWSRVTGRTRAVLSEGLRGLGAPLKPGFYEGLEELLIGADLGPTLAARIAEGVRKRRPGSVEQAREALEAELAEAMSKAPRSLNLAAHPSCVLFYGINGAGKTTTVGKLAHRLKQDGRRPLVVAADTFRAAGIEQVVAWAERAGVPSFAGQPGGDPAAAVFDGLKMAAARGHDVVLVDTAGRLQTQRNLLEELAKVGRVAARALEGAPHESMLVLDAVVGQSSLSQARAFNQALPITGLVLAKMDGTAKGGAVIAIEAALGMPTKLVGVGEDIDDLAEFDPSSFAQALFAEAA